MAKKITRIVLTGGPAAGKTSLISRILKEFKQDDGWKVITIPETATDLISGFGIKPFGNCVSMLEFQYFVIADQLHKEKLALKAAEMVPEENVLIIYDRALFDDKAYISDEEFRTVLSYFGKTEEEVLAGYDAVLHLVSCANGAEFAYNFGNAARYESIEEARRMDNRTMQAWQAHPNLRIIDNSLDFEDKLRRGLRAVYEAVGQTMPEVVWHKYLVEMPEVEELEKKYGAVGVSMMQTYLSGGTQQLRRRVRQQQNGTEYLYFYTEKRETETELWETEKPITEQEYIRFLMEGDPALFPVRKTKYRFGYADHLYQLDVYPFDSSKAMLRIALDKEETEAPLPPEIRMIREVTGEKAYKNSVLAKRQAL